MKILVMSCDKNQDLWYPYYHCMERYGPDHPEIFYCTETFNNPYYKTIHCNYSINAGTKRVYDAIKQIDDNYIILMIDDLFLREKVDNDFIMSLIKYFDDTIGAINFERSFDEEDGPFNDVLLMRNPKGKYKTSVMCQLGRKSAMLKIFNCKTDCGSFEKGNDAKGYKFLISKTGRFLNGGGCDRQGFGIRQGKGNYECKDFFDKEGIKINYSIRGFFDK